MINENEWIWERTQTFMPHNFVGVLDVLLLFFEAMRNRNKNKTHDRIPFLKVYSSNFFLFFLVMLLLLFFYLTISLFSSSFIHLCLGFCKWIDECTLLFFPISVSSYTKEPTNATGDKKNLNIWDFSLAHSYNSLWGCASHTAVATLYFFFTSKHVFTWKLLSSACLPSLSCVKWHCCRANFFLIHNTRLRYDFFHSLCVYSSFAAIRCSFYPISL